jgi:hypothetical protein
MRSLTRPRQRDLRAVWVSFSTYTNVEGLSLSFPFLVNFPEVGLCDLQPVCPPPRDNNWMAEPVVVKRAMYDYIMVPEPISAAT